VPSPRQTKLQDRITVYCVTETHGLSKLDANMNKIRWVF